MTVAALRLHPPALGRTAGLALLLVAELGAIEAAAPGYLTLDGLLDASRQFAEAGLVAVGMTLVIITGGIDLSVGALMALVSVTVGFGYQAGLPMAAAVLAGLVAGAVGGLFNGIMVTSLRLHPLMVTLGTFALYRGIAYAVSNADAVSTFPDWFAIFGQSDIGGLVPLQLVLFAAAALAVGVLLARSWFGRYVYAIGNNETAARFSGIDTRAVKIAVYTLSGVLVALASVIYTSRISSARANAGYGLELTVIAMVVLGGTRITGGSGSILGTVLGVLVLAYLQDGLSYAGVRSDWGLVVIGAFLIAGVFLNEFFRKPVR
jgi:rhamnose transport system permease protein